MRERLAGWALACVACLWLYWPGLTAWFAMDDFAWLGLRASVPDAGGWLPVLFSPKAQGTIRPLSERLYFMGLEGLFGMEALPFRIVAFATQLLNLWLVLRLVQRVSGSLAAGVAAALLWTANSSLALAMSWSSAYNQILWPCFMLGACNARWTWLTTGARRARWAEWALYLLGFGALELQVVYPVLAAALTLTYYRERWRELIPLFVVAGGYTALNRSLARPSDSSVYTLYWDGSMFGTLWTYVRMATGLWRPERVPENAEWWLAAEFLVGVGALAGLAWLAWKREKWALFAVVWFFAALGPILPLKNHVSDYYLTVPSLGLAMALGLAVARRPWWALAPVVAYAAGSGYWARETVNYNHTRAEQGRVLLGGVREASRLHPGAAILLTAVSSEQYWGVMNDNPFRLIPGLRVYLAPGGDENIEKHPELGDPAAFVMPGPTARAALEAGQAVVYSPAGGKLRNVTTLWQSIARQRWGGELSPMVELGQPLFSTQLEAGWHPIEQGFRWSAGRAALRLGATAEVTRLTIDAFRGGEAGVRGAVKLVARVNGTEVGRWEMPRDDSALAVTAPLPAGLDKSEPVRVDFEITPVLREDGTGGRELGLAFSKIGLR